MAHETHSTPELVVLQMLFFMSYLISPLKDDLFSFAVDHTYWITRLIGVNVLKSLFLVIFSPTHTSKYNVNHKPNDVERKVTKYRRRSTEEPDYLRIITTRCAGVLLRREEYKNQTNV